MHNLFHLLLHALQVPLFLLDSCLWGTVVRFAQLSGLGGRGVFLPVLGAIGGSDTVLAVTLFILIPGGFWAAEV